MRILWVNGFGEYSLHAGTIHERAIGFFHCVYFLLKELAKLGHDVQYVCACGKEREGVFDGVRYRCLSDLLQNDTILEESRQGAFDVVVDTELWDYHYSSLENCKKVAYVHNVAYGNKLFGEHGGKQYGCDLVVAVSDFHADCLLKNHPGVRDKFVVIGHGLDFDSMPVGEHRKSTIIFCQAPHKGIEDAETVFRGVRETSSSVEMTVCSSAELYGLPDSQQKLAVLSRLSQTEGVSVVPVRPHSEYLKLMSDHRVQIYPGIPETFGLTVLESMSVGTPVVTWSSSGNVKQLVSQVGGGVLVDRYDLDRFVAEVVRLLENDTEWEKLSSSGREKSTVFTWKDVALKWELALLDLVD